MLTLRGDSVLPDPRLSDDLHTHCPACTARAPWVGDVVTAYRWSRAGRAIGEIVPHPSAALFDAVLLLEAEVAERDVAEMQLENERARAKGKAGG